MDKKGYCDQIESELARLDAWLKELDTCDAHFRAQTQYGRQLEALQSIRSRARDGVQEIKEASEQGWLALQPKMEGILSELRSAAARSIPVFTRRVKWPG